MTGGMGDVTNTFAYDAYGRLTEKVGLDDILFCYNGKYGVITEPSGLVYMRARYYSPELRRFINADVVAGEISNAITLNRYAYANGNPISNVDPLGLTAERGGLISSAFDYMSYGSDLYDDLSDIYHIGIDTYDYLKYGFYVTRKGEYAIIKGAHTKAAFRRGIKGTRYSFKNAGKYPNVFGYIDPKTAAKSALNPKSVSGALGYFFIVVDVGDGIYENIQAGTRPQKIVSDAVVDAGMGIGLTALGAAVGSLIPIPILGTAFGAAVGAGLDDLANNLIIDGKSVTEWVKEGAGYVADAVVDAGEAVVDFVEDAAEWVVDTAEEVWDATTDAVEDAVDWIADTASNAWDSVTGWFSGIFD